MDTSDNVALIKRVSFWIVALLPLLLLIISLSNPNLRLFRSFGNWALYTLIFIMFLKPVSVITKSKLLLQIRGFRRELGLVAFWFFLFHAVGSIYVNQFFFVTDYLGLSNYLFWGAIAAIFMIVLGITSNNISMRLLKKNWKRIQTVAYVAFIAALLHVGFIRGGRNIGFYVSIAILFVALKIIEFYVQRAEHVANA